MPSITHWARLDPDPRLNSIEKGLAAQIRDPLWMLTRQWQIGEFLGEDSASPAYAQIMARRAPFQKWRPMKGTQLSLLDPFANQLPLEPVTESEPFSPRDLSLQVELGQTFELLLLQALKFDIPAELRKVIRDEYQLNTEPDEKEPAVNRFLDVCAQRAVAGVDLYLDAKAITPQPLAELPERLKKKAEIEPFVSKVIEALAHFIAWVEEVFGVLSATDRETPAAWLPERLEYGIEVGAAAPAGGELALSAEPGRDGELGWQAFDLKSISAPGASIEPDKVCVIPTHVRFRGMPNARWWDFENGGVDFGAITPDKTDLAKLVIMDFMLIQGNDWFMVPFEMEVGSLCQVESLLVRDVFGGLTLIERADNPFIQLGERWTAYSTTSGESETGLADFFILPSSVFAFKQTGPTLEEVRFIRDEMANMAWAIEHTIENRIGEPQPGYESDIAAKAVTPSSPTPAPSPTGDNKPPLRYQLQTTVPINWFPLIPVRINQETGDIALELGAALDQREPQGKILNPSLDPYRIREEEVSRGGARALRVVNRARWIDGSTYLWVAREKTSGEGEGSSGLRFDLAILNR